MDAGTTKQLPYIGGMSPREPGRLPASRVLPHLVVMVAVAAVMGLVTAGLAIPFAGVLGLGTKQVADGMELLPAELRAEPLAQKTEIVDAGGNLLASLYDQNRVNVRLDQVSRTMIQAIVAIEDYRFYEHGALDLRGTLRALVTNQANNGVVQGGSSITQQTVKLTLLAQAGDDEELIEAATEDTYARKVRELRYAIAMEEKYSKDWILERYLNIANFGDGAWGIQAAARHYFGKNASKLNLRESAMLAGLVKSPTGYDPTNHPDAAIQRRNVVLNRMAQLNVITEKRAEKVKAKPIGLRLQRVRNGCVDSRAPLFCDFVLAYLKQDPSLGRNPKEREQFLKTGGLTIKTTVDLRYQDAADRSVQRHVFAGDNAIGGLAMVEPGTGEVKAIAQSRPFGAAKQRGGTFINYAVNERYRGAPGFQGGSTFKVFVLAAAVENGTPLTSNIDAPQSVSVPMTQYRMCDGSPYGSDTWDVSSSTTAGTKNLIDGTRESVNTFFAKLEAQTGLCKPFRLARAMGVDLTNPRGVGAEQVPSFTLGSPDVSPLEMAEAYATFPARGMHCDSRPVTEIRNAQNRVLKTYPRSCRQVMRPETADAVNYVLRGVQEPGGFGYERGVSIAQVSAGKTGTTQDSKAVWFAGYTPNLSTAAMIAGANEFGSPIGLDGQSVGGYTVYGASGSSFAGPVWADAMDVVQQWLPDEDFVPPTGDVMNGIPTDIPSVIGMSIDSAAAALREAGFRWDVGSSINSGYAQGLVAGTSPSGVAGRGSTVVLYPSTGVQDRPPRSRGPRGGGRDRDRDRDRGGNRGPGGGNGNGGGNG